MLLVDQLSLVQGLLCLSGGGGGKGQHWEVILLAGEVVQGLHSLDIGKMLITFILSYHSLPVVPQSIRKCW